MRAFNLTFDSSFNKLFDSFTNFDPYFICDQQNINVLNDSLGSVLGYYYLERNHQFIVISPDVDEYMRRLICAHELAHALFHPEVNAFYTLFPIGRYEREANDFAVNLLLMGAKEEYPDYDLYALARVAGIPRQLLESAFGHIIVA